MIIKDPEVRAAVRRLEQAAHEQAGEEVAAIARSTNLRQALAERQEQRKRGFEALVKQAKKMPHNLLGYTERPTANDEVLAKNVCMELEKLFPGWEWLVGCKDGLVRIHSTKLDVGYGYVLHADKLFPHDELVRQARKAGGELLERYGMKTGHFSVDNYLSRRTFRMEGRGGLRLGFQS